MHPPQIAPNHACLHRPPSARGTAGWRATRVRGRGRRGSWRGLSLGVAPAVRRADTTCTRCSGRARRDGRPRPALGPWTLVAAAGGRAAAHIAAHMMPSRPINPPTGSSRTPLGASSLVPSASPTSADLRRPLVVGRDPIDGRGPARACRRAPPRRACYTSHVAWFRVLLRPAGGPAVLHPSRRRPRRRAEDRVRTERDLWPCW